MTARDYKLDMTMVLTVHDAFRREVDRITGMAAEAGDDPRGIMRSALGWRLFKRYLEIHESTENATVWGPMRDRLADPAGRAVLAAVEAGHAALGSLVAAVDGAVNGAPAEEGNGPEGFAGLVDALAAGLREHLKQEEDEGLALIDATLTEQEWSRFGAATLRKVGGGLGTYLPWLLDGASEEWVDTVLSGMPAYGRIAYESTWKAAYQRQSLWAPPAGLLIDDEPDLPGEELSRT